MQRCSPHWRCSFRGAARPFCSPGAAAAVMDSAQAGMAAVALGTRALVRAYRCPQGVMARSQRARGESPRYGAPMPRRALAPLLAPKPTPKPSLAFRRQLLPRNAFPMATLLRFRSLLHSWGWRLRLYLCPQLGKRGTWMRPAGRLAASLCWAGRATETRTGKAKHSRRAKEKQGKKGKMLTLARQTGTSAAAWTTRTQQTTHPEPCY